MSPALSLCALCQLPYTVPFVSIGQTWEGRPQALRSRPPSPFVPKKTWSAPRVGFLRPGGPVCAGAPQVRPSLAQERGRPERLARRSWSNGVAAPGGGVRVQVKAPRSRPAAARERRRARARAAVEHGISGLAALRSRGHPFGGVEVQALEPAARLGGGARAGTRSRARRAEERARRVQRHARAREVQTRRALPGCASA